MHDENGPAPCLAELVELGGLCELRAAASPSCVEACPPRCSRLVPLPSPLLPVVPQLQGPAPGFDDHESLAMERGRGYRCNQLARRWNTPLENEGLRSLVCGCA